MVAEWLASGPAAYDVESPPGIIGDAMALAFRIVLLVVSGMLAGQAGAQNYPNRPMRVVIPNPPGGTLDITARLIGPKMNEVTGQALIVDNRPGADTNIGTEIVARAPADGYTMLLQTVPFVVNPSIFKKLPFDVVNDFAPVSLMVSVPFVLVVNNAVPAKSVKELIAQIDAFIAAYNAEAAPFEWTKVNFRAKSLEGKYSNLYN